MRVVSLWKTGFLYSEVETSSEVTGIDQRLALFSFFTAISLHNSFPPGVFPDLPVAGSTCSMLVFPSYPKR
jgi:hypothetical protein